MRKHAAKYEAFECGESPSCSISWGPIIGAGIGALGSFFGNRGDDRDEVQRVSTSLQYPPGMLQSLRQWYGAPTISPYTYGMLESGQQNLIDQFQEQVLPYISNQAQGMRGLGGSRQGVAEGLASEGLGESLASFQNQMLSNAYNQYLAQQQAAWAAGSPNTTQVTSQPTNTFGNILGGGLAGYGLWDSLFGAGQGYAPVPGDAYQPAREYYSRQ